jgi:hypothetical protein
MGKIDAVSLVVGDRVTRCFCEKIAQNVKVNNNFFGENIAQPCHLWAKRL